MALVPEDLIPRTPLEIDNEVEDLIKKLGTDTAPVFLDVQPEPYAQINDCVNAVQRKVVEAGGNEMFGWQIWILPAVSMIEAEFHSVWVSPEGMLKDITPKEQGAEKILFLPDPKLKYEGIQINNLRLNTSNNRLVDDLILTFDTQFRLQNEGDLAYRNEVSVNAALESNLLMLQGMITKMLIEGHTRNSRCYCTWGQQEKKKFKRCCGENLSDFLDDVVKEHVLGR